MKTRYLSYKIDHHSNPGRREVELANKLPAPKKVGAEVLEKNLLVLLSPRGTRRNHRTDWRISKAEPGRN